MNVIDNVHEVLLGLLPELADVLKQLLANGHGLLVVLVAVAADDLSPVVLEFEIPALSFSVSHVFLEDSLLLHYLLDVFLDLHGFFGVDHYADVVVAGLLHTLGLLGVVLSIDIQVLSQHLLDHGLIKSLIQLLVVARHHALVKCHVSLRILVSLRRVQGLLHVVLELLFLVVLRNHTHFFDLGSVVLLAAGVVVVCGLGHEIFDEGRASGAGQGRTGV